VGVVDRAGAGRRAPMPDLTIPAVSSPYDLERYCDDPRLERATPGRQIRRIF
jgi:hypothetical protein